MAKTRSRPRRRSPVKRRSTRRPSAAKPRRADPLTRDGELSITVVGVGASAGGLEAFRAMLASLPPRPGVAIVCVQHLSPNEESALALLLSSHTELPVVQASQGQLLEVDHVYVIPPNVMIEIKDGTLALSPRPLDRTQHMPIDRFFASLAEMRGGRPIAVVLSGTGSDGAVGIREVKAAGGITVAQQPESAKYDSMPRAAIATGMVDLVLTPGEIGAQLAEIARHPYLHGLRLPREEILITDDQLTRMFDLLRTSNGVDFRHYKMPTIRRRLLRRMALHRLTDVDGYIKILQSNPVELRGLFQDLLIHVTRFFREPESFAALTEEALPKLAAGRDAERPLRVWVCGCATGEEAYSLAITVVEFLQKNQLDLRVQVFATDVSETAIEHARAGVYPASIANDVSPERLRRFFTRTDGHYRVSKVIRDMCVFARQDLTKDPPFSRLDLVMCRNVLIYLDSILQRRLIALFHYALNAHGYLVLGQAETIGAQASLFAIADKKHRIHRKKSAPGPPASIAFPIDLPPLSRKRPLEPESAEARLQLEVSRAIVDRYAPSGVVVDADLQILQFRGQTGAFLEPAPGEASLSLMKMAREGLLYGLRTALHAARKSKAPVRKEGLQVRAAAGWKPVAIEVIPLTALGRQHYLVLFEHETPRAAERGAAGGRKADARGGKASDAKVAMLQRELASSREYLQSIIQELEAANEELQSANEEILSSNEELQSTNEELDTAKEELQSTNEELNTVNEELHGRNEEMSRINSDLMNLVGSVQIAIVIVSGDLRIRRFTPMAEKVLNLIPADLDRSIGHINPNIDCPNLEQLIIDCMDAVTPFERDVQDRQGRWYSLRIRPYKSLENKIDGAVLALFDVDLLKRSERQAQLALEFADAVIAGVSHPVAVLGTDGKVRQINTPFASLLGVAPEKLHGRALADLGGPAWRLAPWFDGQVKDGAVLPAITISGDGDGRSGVSVSGRVMRAPDDTGESVIVVTTRDLSG
jgi:two-component system, chemotaxis family, CheB/CheR fusion protein